MKSLFHKILSTVVIAGCLASCNELKNDPDLDKATTTVSSKPVYVSANSSSIIDLSTLVETSQPVSLVITTHPSKGSLVAIGSSLLQYTPYQKNQKVNDLFVVTLFDSNNTTLQKDTVQILVQNDSTKLPCNIYAVDDFIYVSALYTQVYTNELGNDILCGLDSAQVEVTIYQPTTAYPPFSGTASLSNRNQGITYVPNGSFTGTDKIIYKVQSKLDAKVFGFGAITILQEISCTIAPADDQYVFNVDSLNINGGARIFALSNDHLCTAPRGNQLSITTPPVHGTATWQFQPSDSAAYINFKPDSIKPGTSVLDTLRYQVCENGTCRTAKVTMTLNRP